MCPQFEVFGKQIGSYGLLGIIGLVVCGFVAARLAKSCGIMYEDIILMMVAIALGLFLGGHLLYGVTNIRRIILILRHVGDLGFTDFFRLLFTCFEGMVFYGGFLGGAGALYIASKRSKSVNTADIFDIYAVAIPLFHVFGRIGCFLAGCCYGVESKVGFIVHGNEFSPEINDVVRFPVQLVEAVCNLCIFVLLCVLFYKRKKRGNLIYVYLLVYPVCRFILEFFRGDTIRGGFLSLSTSQWISILLFAIALWRIVMNKSKKRNGMIGLALLLLSSVALAFGDCAQVYASPQSGADAAITSGSQSGADAAITSGPQEESTDKADDSVSPDTLGVAEEPEIPELTPFEKQKMKFWLVFSIVFGVGVCIAIALWGSPQMSLKDRYKAARKKQKQAKKLAEKQEKERKRQEKTKE